MTTDDAPSEPTAVTVARKAWVEREFPTARVESSGPLRLRIELPDEWSFDSSL
jgi:hypothetical protein